MGFEPIAVNTVDGIKAHMEASGVDKSIVLGVAARADQVRRANDWLVSIADENLVPFGAVHPDLADKAAEIRYLIENGVKGIKMHPVINGFYPDDPQWFPVYEELGEDMTLSIHARPIAAPGSRRAAIRRAGAHRQHCAVGSPRLKVIALHLGGFYMVDEAERELMGHENVLVDTTWPPSIRELTADTLTEIIGKHGRAQGLFRDQLPAGGHGNRVGLPGVAAAYLGSGGGHIGGERPEIHRAVAPSVGGAGHAQGMQ